MVSPRPAYSSPNPSRGCSPSIHVVDTASFVSPPSGEGGASWRSAGLGQAQQTELTGKGLPLGQPGALPEPAPEPGSSGQSPSPQGESPIAVPQPPASAAAIQDWLAQANRKMAGLFAAGPSGIESGDGGAAILGAHGSSDVVADAAAVASPAAASKPQSRPVSPAAESIVHEAAPASPLLVSSQRLQTSGGVVSVPAQTPQGRRSPAAGMEPGDATGISQVDLRPASASQSMAREMKQRAASPGVLGNGIGASIGARPEVRESSLRGTGTIGRSNTGHDRSFLSEASNTRRSTRSASGSHDRSVDGSVSRSASDSRSRSSCGSRSRSRSRSCSQSRSGTWAEHADEQASQLVSELGNPPGPANQSVALSVTGAASFRRVGSGDGGQSPGTARSVASLPAGSPVDDISKGHAGGPSPSASMRKSGTLRSTGRGNSSGTFDADADAERDLAALLRSSKKPLAEAEGHSRLEGTVKGGIPRGTLGRGTRRLRQTLELGATQGSYEEDFDEYDSEFDDEEDEDGEDKSDNSCDD